MFDIRVLFHTELQVILFFILGLFLKKHKFMNDQIDDFLSVFVLDVVMPVNIFLSFYDNMSLESMKTGYKLILVGMVVASIVYLIGKFFPMRLDLQRKKIIHYSILISNGSLIGLPLIQGLCGSAGVFYANIFMIPTRILSYVMGESFFNPAYRTSKISEVIKKFITNPIIIAMFLGFLFNMAGISFFSGVRSTLDSLSVCMTPIALILVGSTLTDTMRRASKTFGSIGEMCIFRLLISPCLTYVVCLLLQLGTVETIAAVLINATPVASTCTMFAQKYNGDTSFASNCVCYSTFLSLFTLCFICFVLM